MPTATVRHTRRPPTKTAKAQAAPTCTPQPTRAPSTPKKAPKPAKPPTAKAASSRPSRAPTKKPVRRNNTTAATTSKSPVKATKPPAKATKPPAKPTRFWRALGLSAAGVAAAAGLYAAYRKRGTLMAAVQPMLQRMTPAEKARFVKKCNAKGVKGKTAKGVVKGVDKGRGKAGYVSAVVVAVVALVLAVSYSLGKTRSGLSGRDDTDPYNTAGDTLIGMEVGKPRTALVENSTDSTDSDHSSDSDTSAYNSDTSSEDLDDDDDNTQNIKNRIRVLEELLEPYVGDTTWKKRAHDLKKMKITELFTRRLRELHNTCKRLTKDSPGTCHSERACAWMKDTNHLQNDPFCGSKEFANDVNRRKYVFEATPEYITHQAGQPQSQFEGYWKGMLNKQFV